MKNWWLFFSLVINLSALLWDLTALKFSFTWVRHKGPQDPPNMKKILFLSYFGFKLKNFLSDCFLISHVHIYGWEDSWRARQAESDHWRPSQGPQNSPKIYISFTFWPINEKLVFKLFPLVHMSPLWWGLHLLTFWCPWYPWILCRGPTWPRKKWNLFYFFHFFLF